MSKRNDKKNAPIVTDLSVLNPEDRAAEIKSAETQRLALTVEIERVMREYAKESGDKSLARRAAKVGKAKNDYSEKR